MRLSIPTFVRRETYLRASRALHDARAAYHDEKAENVALHGVMAQQKDYIAVLEQGRAAWQSEATEIRASLLRLPVYEGLVGPLPLVPMVADLAQDHSALTERIERVLDLILARRDMDLIDQSGEEYATLNKIAGLLQGQVTNAPDTVEGLDG